ncbi:MAG TPA: hypothetical protein VII28_03090, partial [Puia sp.]
LCAGLAMIEIGIQLTDCTVCHFYIPNIPVQVVSHGKGSRIFHFADDAGPFRMDSVFPKDQCSIVVFGKPGFLITGYQAVNKIAAY